MQVEDPYEDGKQARLADEPVTNNPYDCCLLCIVMFEDWQLGWMMTDQLIQLGFFTRQSEDFNRQAF